MTERIAKLHAAAVISSLKRDNYRTCTFTLDMHLEAVPGQFVMIWLPGFDEKPFSLVSADPVRVMITNVGPFTSLVQDLHVGDRLWVRGPFGHGFEPGDTDKQVLLVGGGYGVAPLLWLAQRLAERDTRVKAVIGARTRDELLYVDRFAALAKESDRADIDLVVTTDDGSAGTRGIVTSVVQPLLAQGGVDRMYACGPHPMLLALTALARSHHIPCQLSWEEYMRCGMGLCGACELDGALLCMDGPVVAVEP